MSRWISLTMLLAVIIATGWMLYRVMASFLLPLFLASVLVVIFRPVHSWILQKCRQRQYTAAGLTTALILLVVLVPFCGVLALGVHEGLEALSGDVLQKTEQQISRLRHTVGLQIPLQQFTSEDGRTTYFLKDLDEQIRALPDQLPSPQEAPSVEVDRIWYARQALPALRFNLQSLERKVEENPDATEHESLDVARVRRLVLRSGDAAFRDLDEMIQTLEDTQTYLDSKPLPDRTSVAETHAEADGQPPPEEESQAHAEAEQRMRAEALRSRFARIKASYESFRIDLFGGAVWAWLTDVANPDTRQIESIRAQIEQYLRGWLPSVAGHATAIVGSFLLGLAIMTISIFYFLKDGPRMIHTFMRLSPLDDRYEQELLSEFDTVSRAVVLATLLSAVVQGVLAGLGYFVVGFQPVVLLTLLTTLFAFVPFVGAAAVWVPACLWLAFVEQRFFAAFALFAYGALIVSMADNVVKPYVLHGQSKLHPLLALLSVLGGVQALGPIGILVGPMVVSFLQALLNILNQELTSLGSEESASAKTA